MAFLNGNKILNVTYIEGDPETRKEGYDKGYEDGAQSEYDKFWDAHQYNGTRNNYSDAFGGWMSENFCPKYSMYVTYAQYMFRQFKGEPIDMVEHLKQYGLVLDFSGCGNFKGAFNATPFTRLGKIDMSNAFNTAFLFSYSRKLETIDELDIGENSSHSEYGDEFLCCDSLRNITIKGIINRGGWDFGYCTKLTGESLKSIINALSSSLYLWITLPRTAVINAFGSTDSDEWQNLINTKPNWSITLSWG